jgi:hypothetical protein
MVWLSNGSNSSISSTVSFTAMNSTMADGPAHFNVTHSSLKGKALHIFNDRAVEPKRDNG